MRIEDLLDYLYPIDLYNGNITLQDDGQGAYIKSWDVIGVKRPTTDDIEALITQHSEDIILKQQINPIIKSQLVELDFKSIRALRENDVEKIEELNLQAEELRAQLL